MLKCIESLCLYKELSVCTGYIYMLLSKSYNVISKIQFELLNVHASIFIQFFCLIKKSRSHVSHVSELSTSTQIKPISRFLRIQNPLGMSTL